MDQFQCCHLTKAMIPTNYIEHLRLQIMHMVTVVLLLLQVLLSIFSMHTFQLLFPVSLFVVPLRQVLCLFHPFFLYDLSHAERAETTDPPQFLSLAWHLVSNVKKIFKFVDDLRFIFFFRACQLECSL